MQELHTRVDTENCLSDPDHYKLCSETMCVPTSETCPCPIGEVQCSDGSCLPYQLICHTDARCRDSDEEYCSTDTSQGLPASAVAAIVSAMVVVCVLLFLLLYFLYLRRQRNNTSRESQAALDPLQKEKMSDEINYACTLNRNFKTRHKNSPEKNTNGNSLLQSRCSKSYFSKVVDRINCFENQTGCPECEKSDDSCIISACEQYSATDKSDTKNKCDDPIFNKPISSQESPLVKTKDTIESADKSPKNYDAKVTANEDIPVKLGKYIYKPRSRKPPVIYHSYVPSHTEPSTPTSVDFDKDKIPFLFPQEFLCASTPKQTAKQLVFQTGQDIEYMDE